MHLSPSEQSDAIERVVREPTLKLRACNFTGMIKKDFAAPATGALSFWFSTITEE